MREVLDIIALMFISIGIAFDLVGCIGLVRLPDVYNRLQAATKCVTLGTCGILFGVFLLEGLNASGLKALLAILFVLLTAPVAAHAIARGAHRSGVRLSPENAVDRYAETEATERPSAPEVPS